MLNCFFFFVKKLIVSFFFLLYLVKYLIKILKILNIIKVFNNTRLFVFTIDTMVYFGSRSVKLNKEDKFDLIQILGKLVTDLLKNNYNRQIIENKQNVDRLTNNYNKILEAAIKLLLKM